MPAKERGSRGSGVTCPPPSTEATRSRLHGIVEGTRRGMDTGSDLDPCLSSALTSGQPTGESLALCASVSSSVRRGDAGHTEPTAGGGGTVFSARTKQGLRLCPSGAVPPTPSLSSLLGSSLPEATPPVRGENTSVCPPVRRCLAVGSCRGHQPREQRKGREERKPLS